MMPSFIPDLSVILTFALASIVLIVTPGPDMALQISRTVNYGRAHGIAASFGANAGILVHSGLVAFGISILIVAAPAAFFALKIAGALYLLWLAYQAVVHGGGLKIAARDVRVPSLRESFLSGLGINLLNPKVVLFFITFLPQFVVHEDPAATGKLFFLGAEFVLLSIPFNLLLVALAGQIAELFRTSKWVARVLNYSFAAVFTAFAGVILTAQARHA